MIIFFLCRVLFFSTSNIGLYIVIDDQVNNSKQFKILKVLLIFTPLFTPADILQIKCHQILSLSALVSQFLFPHYTVKLYLIITPPPHPNTPCLILANYPGELPTMVLFKVFYSPLLQQRHSAYPLVTLRGQSQLGILQRQLSTVLRGCVHRVYSIVLDTCTEQSHGMFL